MERRTGSPRLSLWGYNYHYMAGTSMWDRIISHVQKQWKSRSNVQEIFKASVFKKQVKGSFAAHWREKYQSKCINIYQNQGSMTSIYHSY